MMSTTKASAEPKEKEGESKERVDFKANVVDNKGERDTRAAAEPNVESNVDSSRLRKKAAHKEAKPMGVYTRNLSTKPQIEYPVLWGTNMKALVKEKAAEGLWMTDVPKPAIGPNDVLIKVTKTAICGTDVHIYNWDAWAARNVPTPMTVGHEYVGIVDEVGKEVRGIEPGMRVTGEGHITCGHCRNCKGGREHLCPYTVGVGVNRPGAFAEYISLPARNVFPLNDPKVTDDTASFMDALGNAVHTALSFDLIGEDVLITGAGPIGSMAAAVCKKVGARHVVITDVNDYRLDLAKECGATRAINVGGADPIGTIKATMDELGMTEGWDVGLEMSGHESAFHGMFETMNTGK